MLEDARRGQRLPALEAAGARAAGRHSIPGIPVVLDWSPSNLHQHRHRQPAEALFALTLNRLPTFGRGQQRAVGEWRGVGSSQQWTVGSRGQPLRIATRCAKASPASRCGTDSTPSREARAAVRMSEFHIQEPPRSTPPGLSSLPPARCTHQ